MTAYGKSKWKMPIIGNSISQQRIFAHIYNILLLSYSDQLSYHWAPKYQPSRLKLYYHSVYWYNKYKKCFDEAIVYSQTNQLNRNKSE